MSDSKLILLGVISSVHGIKGEVIIKAFTEQADSLETLPLHDKQGNSYKISVIRAHKPSGGFVCAIDGVTTRSAAEALQKIALYCPRELLPETSEEEFYVEDLKNLKVVDAENNHIGEISGVFNFGAGDIIEVRFTDSKKTEMFSFTKELFPVITKDYVVLVLTRHSE